jgi:membrane-bound lytic murein transglycosylase B
VRVPDNFDYLLANREVMKSPSEWGALGISDIHGRAIPNHGAASILLPAGAEGAAFMVFKNFEVIESYNTADAYVIAVGHLSDRIAGAGALQGNWPREDRALSYAERIELQTELTAQGFDTQKIDAKIGPLTINAVRAWQVSQGEVPDGYASPQLLERLRLSR